MKSLHALRVCCVSFALLLTGLAAAQAPLPAGITHVTTVEGIAEYQLANGLKVLLFRDPSKATITVNMTYLVGSADESYGETGMAHLLEHMLFKGSTKYPDILAAIRQHGAQFNGTTSWDRTNYFETFDATDANLEWALDLEADRMVNAFVAQSDLDTEMTVVRNEFESGENNPTGVLYQRVLSTAYLWHSYGKSPIGSRSDIEGVPIERLKAFYQKHYQPDNAVLVVAGRFEEPRTLQLIATKFGVIPRPTRELTDNYTIEPTQDGEREVIVRRVGDVQIVMVGYHVPAGAHEDFVPLQLAAEVLGDEPSGRLYKALVEPGLASQIALQTLQLRDPGMVIFFAMVPQDGDVEQVRTVMTATIDGLRENPITAEEVERIRNQALSSFEQQMNNSQSIAIQLSNWASIGDWRLLFLDRDRVRSASAEATQSAALKYLKSSNRTVGIFIPGEPDRSEIPERPDVTAMLQGYKGDEARAEGEAFDPTPANIDSRTSRVDLPGGIKLVMLPKETRGDAVNALIRLNYGDENSLKGVGRYAAMTTQMLMRGTRNTSRQEIQDELARLQSQLNVFGGAGLASANIQSTRANLAEVITLAIEVLREPAFPESELTTLKELQITSIEAQRSEPQAIVPRAYQRHWGRNYSPDDPRYVRTVEDDLAFINSVTVANLRDFHEDFARRGRRRRRLRSERGPRADHAGARQLAQPEAVQRRAESLRAPRDGSQERRLQYPGQGERVLPGRHADRDARLARRLPGTPVRQLHLGIGSRIATVRPHPRPRRLELWRRVRVQRFASKRRRAVHRECDLGSAERGAGRSVVPRRARERPTRRLHRGRVRPSEGQLGAATPGRPHAGRRRSESARALDARRAHDGLGRGARGEGRSPHRRAGPRRDAPASRRLEDDLHEGRRFRGGRLRAMS
jgi:zinc protease